MSQKYVWNTARQQQWNTFYVHVLNCIDFQYLLVSTMVCCVASCRLSSQSGATWSHGHCSFTHCWNHCLAIEHFGFSLHGQSFIHTWVWHAGGGMLMNRICYWVCGELCVVIHMHMYLRLVKEQNYYVKVNDSVYIYTILTSISCSSRSCMDLMLLPCNQSSYQPYT